MIEGLVRHDTEMRVDGDLEASSIISVFAGDAHKYCDHIPLYRQSVILERDTGLKLSRATLDGWMLQVGDLVMPMMGAMRKELLRGTYIQADETSV